MGRALGGSVAGFASARSFAGGGAGSATTGEGGVGATKIGSACLVSATVAEGTALGEACSEAGRLVSHQPMANASSSATTNAPKFSQIGRAFGSPAAMEAVVGLGPSLPGTALSE